MLFISIPLLFIGISVLGILLFLLRKYPATAGLEPQETSGGLWKNFFPELDTELKKIHFRSAFRAILMELEKIVRKARLFIVATERMFDSLIHRIRRVQNRQSVKQEIMKEAPVDTVVAVIPTEPIPDRLQKAKDAGISNVHVKSKPDPAEAEKIALKSRETEIIASLAQNPKDFNSYRELGDIYVKLENWSDAKDSLQTALRLKRDDKELAEKLSSVLEKMLGRN